MAALIRCRAFPLPFATQGRLAPSRFRSPEMELLLAFVDQLVLEAGHFRALAAEPAFRRIRVQT